ncbi:MAG: glycerate kinase type-2 family protein [Candidatus Bipolaricaulaceae bacterium]
MADQRDKAGRMRQQLQAVIQAALRAVEPARCVRRAAHRARDALLVDGRRYDLARLRRAWVVGLGKAAPRMAVAVEEILGDRLAGGVVVTAAGCGVPTQRVEVVEASHPVPDQRSLAAGRRIVDTVQGAGEEDLVVVLISGGGSALLTLPAHGVSLEDLQATGELLLRSGAGIQEVNAVRKHLSQVKGGQLARLAAPAQVVALILSDVPGDRLDAIASGPCVPDPTTFADAQRVLRRHGLWDQVPAAVRARLAAGVAGRLPETPKPGDPDLGRVHTVVIGSGGVAAEAAREEGERLGYPGIILTTTLEGEAREVGRVVAALAREMARWGRPIPAPGLVVAAGETTVTVRGPGKGGRNQELALAAAAGIAGQPGVVIAAVGTDGRDGPTDAAGGVVDGGTAARIRGAGLEPWDCLAQNDAYTALSTAGDLLITGPTGTNVADLCIVLVGREDR